MNDEAEPVVGAWYKLVDDDKTFTVVAVDEDEGLLEIQHVDGDIEEIELVTWQDMSLELVEDPGQWRAALDAEDEEFDDDDDDEDDDDEDEDDEDWDDDDGEDWN